MKQLIIRVSPDLHRRIAARAAREGKSVNAWVGELLQHSVDADPGDRHAQARAKAAALGILRDNGARPVDDATRQRVIEQLRPHGKAILAELEADRNSR